jgi:hypothetical protein
MMHDFGVFKLFPPPAGVFDLISEFWNKKYLIFFLLKSKNSVLEYFQELFKSKVIYGLI